MSVIDGGKKRGLVRIRERGLTSLAMILLPRSPASMTVVPLPEKGS